LCIIYTKLSLFAANVQSNFPTFPKKLLIIEIMVYQFVYRDNKKIVVKKTNQLICVPDASDWHTIIHIANRKNAVIYKIIFFIYCTFQSVFIPPKTGFGKKSVEIAQVKIFCLLRFN
jgi:hypothetical protein